MAASRLNSARSDSPFHPSPAAPGPELDPRAVHRPPAPRRRLDRVPPRVGFVLLPSRRARRRDRATRVPAASRARPRVTARARRRGNHRKRAVDFPSYTRLGGGTADEIVARARLEDVDATRARATMDARGVTSSPRRPPRGARDVPSDARARGRCEATVGRTQAGTGGARSRSPPAVVDARGRGDIRCHPIYSIHSIHSTHSIGLARGWTSVYPGCRSVERPRSQPAAARRARRARRRRGWTSSSVGARTRGRRTSSSRRRR